ncbi:MAG: helix-turn-helix domain-containing protein [Phycisphaerae bacterium]
MRTDSSAQLAAAGLRPLLDRKQAAKFLQVSERSLDTYTKAGIIPAVRFGNRVRFAPADLEAFIEGCKI